MQTSANKRSKPRVYSLKHQFFFDFYENKIKDTRTDQKARVL